MYLPPARSPRRSALLAALLALGSPLLVGACERPAPVSPDAGPGAAQQALVDRASEALDALRGDPKLAGMEHFLTEAKAVLIFPRLIKASMIFGGEGGNGIMMLRGTDGAWQGPAFYSLGAASAGFQFGYQEAAVALFLMSDAAVERLLEQGLVLGADASVALGPRSNDRGAAVSDTISAEVYQFSMVAGAYAGVALDGAVIKERPKHQREYYGSELSAREVLKEGKAPARLNEALLAALAPKPAATPAKPATPAAAPPANAPPGDAAPESAPPNATAAPSPGDASPEEGAGHPAPDTAAPAGSGAPAPSPAPPR